MRTTHGLLAVVTLAVLAGCPERRTATEVDSGSAPVVSAKPVETQTTADSGVPATGDQQSEEACVDAWLSKNKLDAYGSPEGTMYAGGSPLFDERTGETKPRLEFVYARQPEAKKACHAAAP